MNYFDRSGHSAILVFASLLFLGTIGAISSVTVQAIGDIVHGNEFDIGRYGIAALSGFVGGALGFVNPVLGAAVQGAMSTGLNMAYDEAQGITVYDVGDYLLSIGLSALVSGLTAKGFEGIMKVTGAFDTAILFGDNLAQWFDCGNKVFFEMLCDLTPYYLAYSLVNEASGLIGGWIPNYVRDVVALKKLDHSWQDSIRYAF